MNKMTEFPEEHKIKAIFQTPQGKTILNRVIETIKRYKMIKQGDRIVLGVSGGGDSVFLVLVLYSLKQLFDMQIYLAHLNHLLRENAYQDEEFVRTIGETLSLPVVTERIDVRGKAKPGQNLEEVARNLRIDFLIRTRNSLNADKIALGHTLTDAVETFIFNLSRGAGFQGLTGIWPVREAIIRPLINFKRSEIRDFLKSTRIPYMEDPTNYDLNLARNYIRHKVIPILEKRFPRVQEHISQTAELNRELTSFLDTHIPKREEIIKFRDDNFEVLNIEKLLKLFPIQQRWFFYRNYELGYQEIERLLIKLKTGGHLDTKSYDIWISFGEMLISTKGQVTFKPIKQIKWTSKCLEILEYNMIFQLHEFRCKEVNETRNSVVFDKNEIDRESLCVRTWRYGDKINISGKMIKVKDIFQKYRVPVWRRRLWIVVEDKEGILWVVNLAKASRPKKGSRCFKLEVKKAHEQKGWIFDY